MNKIKLSNIVFKNGSVLHDGKVVNIDGIVSLSDHFEYSDLGISSVMVRVREFPRSMTFKQLRKLVVTKCISSLFGDSKPLPILNDHTIHDEAEEALFVNFYTGIVEMCDIEFQDYNPYVLPFDKDKLQTDDKDEYYLTINGNRHLCIESNQRTTHFFRDILILSNLDDRCIIVDEEKNMDDLRDASDYTDKSWNFIIEEKESDVEECVDYILDASSIRDAYNEVLTNELINWEIDPISKNQLIARISKVTDEEHKDKFYFKSNYLELVMLKAKQEINPSLLFMEVLQANDEDFAHGLKKLGFMFS